MSNKAKSRGQVSPSANSKLTTTAAELRAATKTLNDHGVAVWRIRPGEKLPKDPAWTAREFDPRTFRDGHNIGALSGPQSDGRKPGRSLLWFDLETPEAVEVGDRVIPAAGSIIEGRPGNPRSHRGVWIADDSIPDFALFPEHEDTAIGLRARGYAGRLAGTLQARHLTRTHPGKKGQPVREMVVELFGTGRQVNVGPSVWVSKDGTRRERREIVQLPTPDEIITYGYPDAVGWFEEITEKCGGEIISHCWKRTQIRVTGEPPKTRGKATRVRDLKFPGIEPASLNGHHKTPGAGVASQGGYGLVVIRGVKFGLEERVNRFRAYLEKLSLTEWGDGGNQAFRVARVGANDMALDDHPDLLLSLLVERNDREAPKDRWDECDLRHKVKDAIKAGRGAEGDEFPYGWKLFEGVKDPDARGGGNKPTKPPKSGKAVAVTADTITPKPVPWLIRDLLPFGMLSLLAGHGGVGKSTICFHWAAGVSTGKLTGKRESVLLCCPEDPSEYVTVPRLIAAGADLKRVHILKGIGDKSDPNSLTQLSLPSDAEKLAALAVETGAKLIVVDPFLSMVDDDISSHVDAEIRRALSPLIALAEKTGAALVCVVHTNKARTTDAADKVMASKALTNAARMAMIAGRDEADPPGVFTLLRYKSNIVPPAVLTSALQYRTVANDDGGGSRVEWLNPVEKTAADLLDTPRRDRPSTLTKSAEDFLRELFKDTDAVTIAEAKEHMKAAGVEFSEPTLRRARDRVGIGYRRRPNTTPAVWEWHRLNGSAAGVDPASQSGQGFK